MKSSLLAHPSLVFLAVTVVASFTGCGGPGTKSATGVSATEYEQVFVLGSNIPVLVPKGSGARRVHSISPAIIILQDDIQRALGPGPVSMH